MEDEKSGFTGLWLVAGAFALALAGVAVLRYQRAEAPAVVAAEPVAATEATVAPVAALGNAPAIATGVASDTVVVTAPAFDTVRVEQDGSALVAGRAPVGATLRVLLDGIEVATAPVDPVGKFAALFSLPASGAARLMTLETVLPDGTVSLSGDSVAIAPTVAPMVDAAVVALADPAIPALPPQAADALPDAAVTAPAAIMVTDAGAAVLQSTAGSPSPDAMPGQAIDVTIDAISYTPNGTVQLSGQAASGAFLRLYLDNGELMTLTAPDAGPWFATLPDVAPGLYTLRVDQIAADGTVASRFETPFKRETPEALAAVTAPVAVIADAGGDTASKPTVAPAKGGAATVSVLTETPDVAASSELQAAPSTQAVVQAPTLAAELPADGGMATTPLPPAPVTLTVQPGLSLWKIARQNYGSGVMYVQVFEANRDKIKDPNLIYPGQIFAMPAVP